MGAKERLQREDVSSLIDSTPGSSVLPVRESKGVLGDLSLLLGGNLSRVIVSFGAAFLLARMLAPENLAPFSLYQMIVDLSVAFIGTWSAGAIVRFGREELLRSGSLSRTLAVRGLVVGSMFIVFVGIFFVSRAWLEAFVGLPMWILYLLPLSVIFLVVMETAHHVFIAGSQFHLASMFSAVQKAVFFGGVGIVFLLGVREKPEPIVLALVASAVIAAVWAVSKLRWSAIRPLHVSRLHSKRFLVFSLPIFLNAVALSVINWVDLAVIKDVLGDASVGTYHMAYVGFNVLAGIGLAVNTLFLPKIVSLRIQKKESALRHYTQLVVPSLAVVWSFALMIAILVIPLVVPAILGARYEGTVAPLQILVCASAFQFMHMEISSVIGAFDLTLQGTMVNIVAAGVNIALDLLLVPMYGIVGASWATCGAMLTALLGSAWLVSRRMPLLDRAWILPVGTSVVCLVLANTSFGLITDLSIFGATIFGGSIAVRRFRLIDERVLSIVALVEMPERAQHLLVRTLGFLGVRPGSTP